MEHDHDAREEVMITSIAGQERQQREEQDDLQERRRDAADAVDLQV